MTLTFYFDFISPYAYLAWQELPALAARHGRTLELRPVLLAALLNHWGQLGPAEIAPKRAFVFRQILRRAARLGVTLTPPPSHPFNPLLALRLVALPELDQAQRCDLVTRLFAATWGGVGRPGGQSGGIADAAAISAALAGSDHDAAALISAASQPEAKRQLVEYGNQALAAGVFGVPTMIADGELFWGTDSLPELDAYLAGEDPLDPATIERWRDLPASAKRQ